jgi:hypothetical protein
VTDTQEMSQKIVREVIIPILEKEVNEGENFAPLRQIYSSILLALWYKEKVQGSILSSAYVNRNKVSGVDVDDKEVSQKIWQEYAEAFKKGAFNIITEEEDKITGDVMPRKYFAGGFKLNDASQVTEYVDKLVGKSRQIFAALLLRGLLLVSAGCVISEPEMPPPGFTPTAPPQMTTSFTPNVRVSDPGVTAFDQNHSSIAVGPSGTIYVVWDSEGNDGIHFSLSTNGGQSFVPSIKVNDEGAAETHCKHPFILVDKHENIYMIWDEKPSSGGNYDVHFSKSTDQGKTFSPAVKVNRGADFVSSYREYAHMAIGPQGQIYITWWSGVVSASIRKFYKPSKIFFAQSHDGGNTFLPSIYVDGLGVTDFQSYPKLYVVDPEKAFL